MKNFYVPPQFEVVRDPQRCVNCKVCVEQCPNGVHRFDETHGRMLADESKCVDCQRCVAYCPTHALKIEKNRCTLRESANWSSDAVEEIWKQAATGGVLLSSMGSPKELPVYWDRLLLNASQVTNPPIDPLREPMETRVFLGKKPERLRRFKPWLGKRSPRLGNLWRFRKRIAPGVEVRKREFPKVGKLTSPYAAYREMVKKRIPEKIDATSLDATIVLYMRCAGYTPQEVANE